MVCLDKEEKDVRNRQRGGFLFKPLRELVLPHAKMKPWSRAKKSHHRIQVWGNPVYCVAVSSSLAVPLK